MCTVKLSNLFHFASDRYQVSYSIRFWFNVQTLKVTYCLFQHIFPLSIASVRGDPPHGALVNTSKASSTVSYKC